ncbi:MAG: TIGR04076 family protein [Eubacteriales bacterium]|nr:TIGR04076 family protein [Eubacteriales bacterium]
MKRFVKEDISFTITVVDGRNNKSGKIDCRNGHEVGDTYTCEYGCPDGFCQKSMLKAFPIMEVVRSGGDLRNLGGDSDSTVNFCCPDGVVTFRLEALKHI